MGNVILYEAIIPIRWRQNFSDHRIHTIVSGQIVQLMMGEERFEGSIITVGDLATVLIIMNETFCWWFQIPGDLEPSAERYHFTGNLLVEMFPALIHNDEGFVDDDGIIGPNLPPQQQQQQQHHHHHHHHHHQQEQHNRLQELEQQQQELEQQQQELEQQQREQLQLL